MPWLDHTVTPTLESHRACRDSDSVRARQAFLHFNRSSTLGTHQTVVPWAAQYQIEQDLLLCRAMVALFEDRFLHGQIAMRGASIREGHFSPNTRRVSRSMPSS